MFTVEDGTGVKGANSYCTVQFMRDYFADRGVDLTAILDATLQAALIAATDYIDTRWGSRLLGSRLWPSLRSRSILTLTGQPADGETITINGTVVTVGTDAEVGETLAATLYNLVTAAMAADEDKVIYSGFIADPDVAALTVFFVRDGITTETDISNGSFNVAASTGYSGKRQPLEFPRAYLTDRNGEAVNGIPEKLKMATCEYANRARTVTLAPDATIDSTIVSQSTAVGPISKSVTYNTGAALNPLKAYPAADRLLQEYVRRGGIIRS